MPKPWERSDKEKVKDHWLELGKSEAEAEELAENWSQGVGEAWGATPDQDSSE